MIFTLEDLVLKYSLHKILLVLGLMVSSSPCVCWFYLYLDCQWPYGRDSCPSGFLQHVAFGIGPV